MQEVEHKRCADAKALVPIGRSIQLDPDCSTCGGCIFNSRLEYDTVLCQKFLSGPVSSILHDSIMQRFDTNLESIPALLDISQTYE